MKFCPNCGEKIDDDAKVCTKCGYVLKSSQPNNITNNAKYATFWERLAAILIDGFILSFACRILGIDVSKGASEIGVGGSLIQVAIYAAYFALMESSKYQATVGKMIMKIKVTDENFNRIDLSRALGRYFAKILSAIILFIGYLMMLDSPKSQCLHDRLAHTLVINE